MKKLALALALMFLASTVHASILGSFIRRGPLDAPVFNTLDDVNAEYIIKGDGNTAAAFEVGDSVVAYGQFQNITTSDGFFFNTDLEDENAGGAGYTLFFKSVVTITSIVDDEGSIGGGDGIAERIFWSTTGVEARENNDGVDFNFLAGIAAVDAVWGDANFVTLFDATDSDDYFVSVDAPINFSDIIAGREVNSFFGLTEEFPSDLGIEQDFVTNPNGPFTDSDMYKHALYGNTQARNFQIGIPPVIGDDVFDLATDTEITFASVIPEPGSCLVWLGLMGLALSVNPRRRK